MKIITSILAFFSIALFAGTTVLNALPAISPTDIAQLEDASFAKTGKYVQIQTGSKLPAYETGDVKTVLGKDIDPNTVVNVYESDSGKGYQLVWTDAQGVHGRGYGPQAKEFTFDLFIVASTTP